MKVIIAGSRSLKNSSYVVEAWKGYEKQYGRITEVVCGGASGVDSIGRKLANAMSIPVKEFPADWKKDGKRAGIIRNKRMGMYAEGACLVWDGQSGGTFNMLETATRLGLDVYLYIPPTCKTRIIQPWNLKAR